MRVVKPNPAVTPERLVRIAHRLKAMADPTRLHILHVLAEGERCVGDLTTRVGGTQANVSKHLAVLRASGLVRSRREGMNVIYTMEDTAALEVCALMGGCLEKQASRTMAAVSAPIA